MTAEPTSEDDPSKTTLDRFLGDRLAILQPKHGYRAGLDAVLLAASCPGARAAGTLHVLDVGSGVGVAGLAVAARLPMADVTLLERDASTAALARLNVERNALTDRARVFEADITRRLSPADRVALGRERFDVVIANPPYHETHRGRPASDPGKRTAHAMPAGDLEHWARFMASMARPGGHAIIIHRAEAIGELLTAMSGRFGNLTLLPLHAKAAAPAIRLLILGIKGSRAPSRLLPGLVLHDDDGRFRPAINAILRAPGALPVADFG